MKRDFKILLILLGNCILTTGGILIGNNKVELGIVFTMVGASLNTIIAGLDNR